MSRKANFEQSLAINALDGAILSAGAGSGKTFVIVENILLHVEARVKRLASDQWQVEIPKVLSSCFLMTFTNKAVGEMQIRLQNRVLEKRNEVGADQKWWEIVYSNVTLINVLTIHSFCKNIISKAQSSKFPTEIELVNETFLKLKIKQLVNLWYQKKGKMSEKKTLLSYEEISASMYEIFKTPELRIDWEEIKVLSLKEELDAFFCKLLDFFSYNELFTQNKKSLFSGSSSTLGYKGLASFRAIELEHGAINGENFQRYFAYFDELARFPSISKEMSSEELNYRLELKDFHDFYKKIKNDFNLCVNNFDEVIAWKRLLKEMFDYINKHYFEDGKISFADLEYCAYLLLSDSQVLNKISNEISYLIVDEFQDTSSLQFSIIKKALGNDINKLFCVGDKKQAIYGFRGGEVKVFENSLKEFPFSKKFTLKSNYRSSKKVVEFNNLLFEGVLPSGFQFEGHENEAIKMEKQVVESVSEGNVIEYLNYTPDKDNLDQKEALSILEIIKDKIQGGANEITILYRKLGPSRYLIDLLKNNKIDFTAQLKLSSKDEPIVNIFYFLLNIYINKNLTIVKSNLLLLLKNYYSFFDLNFDEKDIDRFIRLVDLFGIGFAFKKFIYDLAVSDTLFEHNFDFIDTLSFFENENPEAILNAINEYNTKFSLEYSYGPNPKVIIMTAHASKGLEFEHVILAGIFSNGRSDSNIKKIGKIPGSFSCPILVNGQLKLMRTPMHFLESELDAYKNFSESKRLLYVACTRAVLSLNWTRIKMEGKDVSDYKNSWINAILKHRPPVDVCEIAIDENKISNKSDLNLIYVDNLGLENTNRHSNIGVISELSVTKLSTLVSCPFKFYLKNIVKLSIDGGFLYSDTEDEIEEKFYSSKDRGTLIHYKISSMIKGKVKDEEIASDKILQFVKTELLKKKYTKIISEKEIKFKFFGQMINAIPDLLLVDDNTFEIWDFKTGMREELSEEAYWFQLMAYAFAVGLSDQIDMEKEFTLKLLYLDQFDVVSKTLKLKEIHSILYLVWKKTDDLSQTNRSHCPFCEYRSICKFSPTLASV